jgi:MSHA biogenesis protein MshQ
VLGLLPTAHVANYVFLGTLPAGCSGSVDLAFNVSNTAAGNICLSTTSSAATAANQPWFGPNIGGRATFGIYRSPLIYLRENY